MKRKVIRKVDAELGIVRLCPRCNEWWPLDLEFWFSNAGTEDGFGPCCKACYEEWRYAKRREQRRVAKELLAR